MSRLTLENFPGLAEGTVRQLNELGMNTTLGLFAEDVQSLSEKSSLPLEELLKIRRRLLVENSAPVFRGDQLFDQMMNSLTILPSGCPNLDELLGGGLYCKEVTELYGLPAVGKTQTCLSVSSYVAVQLQKNTIYVDTGGSFSSKRMEEMMQKKFQWQRDGEGSIRSSMTRIQCIEAFDIYSTLLALDEVKTKLLNWDEEFYQDLALVIVDSATSIISPILGGAQNHGHALMVSFSRVLKSLAVDHNLAVLITNNVVSDYSSNSNSKPALGKTWTHVPDNRVCISTENHQMSSKNLRLIKLTKSCRMPLGVVLPASITEHGLSN